MGKLLSKSADTNKIGRSGRTFLTRAQGVSEMPFRLFNWPVVDCFGLWVKMELIWRWWWTLVSTKLRKQVVRPVGWRK
jgi:hypothetical protein